MRLGKKKLKELKTAFLLILSHYGLNKFEILEIIKLLINEIRIRTEEDKIKRNE